VRYQRKMWSTRAVIGFAGAFLFLAAAMAGTCVPTSEAMASSGRPVPRLISAQPPARRAVRAPSSLQLRAARLIPITKRPKPRPQDPYAGIPWRSALCSWYWQPQGLAGGGYLTPNAMIVAHKRLPFGTRIQFSYRGRTCVAVVMDRGPYVGRREFDLGPGTARALGFDGVDTVSYRIVP
jgi:hypothetical protein